MDVAAAEELLSLAEETADHAYAPDAAAWTVKLDARANDLPAAVAAFEDAGDGTSALRLVASLRVYAQDSGRITEVRAVAEELLARHANSAPSRALAGAQLVLGELAFRQEDQATALEATVGARATAAAVGDRMTQARAEINLARIAFRDGDAARIAAHAKTAASLSDDPRVQSGALHMLGWASYTAGDVAGAMTQFQETAKLYAAQGDRVGLAAELANLGDLALEVRDAPRATGFLREALDVGVETNSRYLIPSLLASISALAAATQRYAEALELAAAAECQYEAAGLAPDPGGGLDAALRDTAVAALGERRATELDREGRRRPYEEVLALARSVLAEDSTS